MNLNKRNISTVCLILGFALFAIGWTTDNTTFSAVAVAFLVISLLLGGRWMRPRRK